MSNYQRADVPGAIYFFTVVTCHRRPWFDREERIEIRREALRRTMTHWSFRIDAMVVLPDHIHCLWGLPEGENDFSVIVAISASIMPIPKTPPARTPPPPR
uniref:Transposase IS200 like n=1 Tax=Candidatus Kentrum sp. SD TaxID=2126332 RepID=A0A450YK95_9GAMM|nr:MAG: Transposase IS200 like [Candidatus Kentron sp. SD]VFK49604.1 MAG: Transposase IS200 like [Candidatus Kentron sp. SD]VFK81111.1 MAG: Transposase IS200 like [Candidatus Kentron sp. SD]